MNAEQFVKSLRRKAAEGDVIEDDAVQRALALANASASGSTALSDQAGTRVLTVIVQFLANVSVKPSTARISCWKAFFPTTLLSVSYLKDIDVLDPLCYAVWNFAKHGFYSPLEKEGKHLFDNLVQFFGSEQGTGQSTSFSLLLSYVLENSPGVQYQTSSMLRAIGKMDVECFDGTVLAQLQEGLFEAAKSDDSDDVLFALRNCISKTVVNLSILERIAEWAIERLSDVRSSNNGRLGLQTDLTALLSNLIWGRPNMQNCVMDLNGLELVLNGIRLDETNPFLREWSLLFVRGMCMDNVRAQHFIQGLDLKEVVTDESLGMQIEYNKVTGKFSVQNKEADH